MFFKRNLINLNMPENLNDYIRGINNMVFKIYWLLLKFEEKLNITNKKIIKVNKKLTKLTKNKKDKSKTKCSSSNSSRSNSSYT